MARQAFSEINVKAAAIAGAVVGFLCWLLSLPFGYEGYGMMGYGGGYGMGMMNGLYPAFGLLTVALGIVLGAFIGAVIGVVYNWALRLR